MAFAPAVLGDTPSDPWRDQCHSTNGDVIYAPWLWTSPFWSFINAGSLVCRHTRFSLQDSQCGPDDKADDDYCYSPSPTGYSLTHVSDSLAQSLDSVAQQGKGVVNDLLWTSAKIAAIAAAGFVAYKVATKRLTR